MKDRKKVIILTLFVVMFILLGGTLALYTWNSLEEERLNLAFMIKQDDFKCSADGGEPIEPSNIAIMPSSCSNSENVLMREINTNVEIKSEYNVNMRLWLDINDLGEPLSQSQNFRYVVTTSSTSCTDGVISSGTFNRKQIGDQVEILNKQYYEDAEEKYYLYIWLDEAETNVETANQPFSFSLNGVCSGDIVPVNRPVLDEGMIPVSISDTGVVTTLNEYDPDWYDYDNQKWANVVLVKNEGTQTRDYYKKNENVTVDPADILAYYVWIPRYKYKIWTTTTDTSPNEIEIVFESSKKSISLGTDIDEYRTHPAFWWDDDNDGTVDDGEMLEGIWVGKFETTGDVTTPTVLPNVSALVNQNIGTQFATSLKFAGGVQSGSTVTFSGNDTYGLTKLSDSHMMKNSEWGAVAYLSHSQYGMIGEITSNSGEVTGFGNGSSYGSTVSGTYTYPQSATGNISGVFDMSGGNGEYVMGKYNNALNENFSILPDGKYYDEYTSDNSLTACNGGKCYGHALYETSWWYFTSELEPPGISEFYIWFERSNYASTGSMFFAAGVPGGNSELSGFRSVIIPVNNYTVNFDANGGSISGGDYRTISYTTSGEHIFTTPFTGEYQIEIWGAQGGNATSSYIGGYGAYSIGTVNLSAGTNLYVNVGGQGDGGIAGTARSGGYNGGGNVIADGSTNRYVAGGGGATHVATSSGLLSELYSNQSAILIVAGGGGGGYAHTTSGYAASGGAAGGYTGNNGGVGSSGGANYGLGGSQTAAGYADGMSTTGVGGFGYGGDAGSGTHGSAGGGGYYGGGGSGGVSGQSNSSGAGGSGYIGNSLLTNKAMYCYNCKTSSDVDTLTYSVKNMSDTPTANYAKSGDGAAKITYYLNAINVLYGYKYGELPIPTRDGYEFAGWYTESDGGIRITKDTEVTIRGNQTLYAHWTAL